ncbi:MAG TPA: NAD(+) diphosphatase [Micromonosporaceae bacterium]
MSAWSRPPLARTVLDRAAHRRTDERWLAAAWDRAHVLVVDSSAGGRALVRDGDRPALVLLDARDAPAVAADGRMFLGVDVDGTPVFAVDAPLPAVPDTRAVTLRQVGHLLSDRDVGLFSAAAALANWHALHVYSPVTGLPTTVREGGWCRVDESGRQMWPRTDPAMIVLVHDGVAGPQGRCLLGNNAAWPDHDGRRSFSCLAGFVEPGESAEAAVAREVGEEVGIELDRIEYAGSQAWPFPSLLMLGFLAQADSAQPLRLDPDEIARARWFTRREIAGVLAGDELDVGDGLWLRLPAAASIARFLVETWADG